MCNVYEAHSPGIQPITRSNALAALLRLSRVHSSERGRLSVQPYLEPSGRLLDDVSSEVRMHVGTLGRVHDELTRINCRAR